MSPNAFSELFLQEVLSFPLVLFVLCWTNALYFLYDLGKLRHVAHEPCHQKICFSHMQKTKVEISCATTQADQHLCFSLHS